MQIVCHIETSARDAQIPDDDGLRALYIRNNMRTAVAAAVRKARAKLEVGGTLTVTYVSDGEQKTRGHNPPKIYSAVYTPPKDAGDAVADVLGVAPAPAVAPAKLPPGVTAEEWAALPQGDKEALAKVYNLVPF
jgi:hypothetical protein